MTGRGTHVLSVVRRREQSVNTRKYRKDFTFYETSTTCEGNAFSFTMLVTDTNYILKHTCMQKCRDVSDDE
jgi:hypothetical protein